MDHAEICRSRMVRSADLPVLYTDLTLISLYELILLDKLQYVIGELFSKYQPGRGRNCCGARLLTGYVTSPFTGTLSTTTLSLGELSRVGYCITLNGRPLNGHPPSVYYVDGDSAFTLFIWEIVS